MEMKFIDGLLKLLFVYFSQWYVLFNVQYECSYFISGILLFFFGGIICFFLYVFYFYILFKYYFVFELR